MFDIPLWLEEIVVIATILWVGWTIRGFFHQRDIESVIDRMIEDGDLEVDPDPEEIEDDFKAYISIKIEKHGDIAYIYEQDTNTFMFQVKDKDEFVDMVNQWAKKSNLDPSEVNLILDEQSSKILENLS